MLVGGLGSSVADDDIAIGSVADRCLVSGVKQTSHFKGVRTVFDPSETSNLIASEAGWAISSSLAIRKGASPMVRPARRS